MLRDVVQPLRQLAAATGRLVPANPVLAIFAGVALIELALLPPGIKTVDEHSMFEVANSLVHGDGFRVPCGLGSMPGVDGCYSRWYPLNSILAVPFVAAADVLAAAVDAPARHVAMATAPAVSALSAAGAAAFTAAIARRLGAGWGAAVLAAVAFAFGTEALTYARSFFAETLCALLASGAVLALGTDGGGRRRRAAGFAALALAVLAKPPMVVLGPAIGLARAISRRDPREMVGPSLASAGGVAVYMGYNQLRFRDPLQFGGEGRGSGVLPTPSWDTIEAIGLFTISPGRGLLWFSPVAVLGAVALFRHRREPLALCCGLVSLAVLAVYLGNPGVDANWATRYLVPILPLLCAGLVLLGPRLRPAIVALLVLGAVIQVPTTLAFYTRYYAEVRDTGASPSSVYWSPSDTPLIQSWPAMMRQLRAARDSDVRELVARPQELLNPQQGEPAEEQDLLRVVALWWWMLPGVGIPRALGIALSVALILAGAALLRAASRAPPGRGAA